MIRPENISDETLEYAAQVAERDSLLDVSGIMARRKRQREDASLRMRVRREQRAEIATNIRALMNRPELSAISVLAQLAALPEDRGHDDRLMDAWPLAWRGWVKIVATISCTSNWVPPEIHYRILITERGREALAARECVTVS
jgi:hypothetical protein